MILHRRIVITHVVGGSVTTGTKQKVRSEQIGIGVWSNGKDYTEQVSAIRMAITKWTENGAW